MLTTATYDDILSEARRVEWRIEDVCGSDRALDFSRPFLPESMARSEYVRGLSPPERLALNHLRAHNYLYLFGTVERFILPFVLDRVQERVGRIDGRLRALLQFADDEAKHIELFRLFRAEFQAGFGVRCDVIGPADGIAATLLDRHPLAVGLLTLHIEWMTQLHYVESVRDVRDLDPQFKSLLRHHWLEEAQHARIDELLIAALTAVCGPDEVLAAVDSYLEACRLLAGALAQQVELDLESLERVAERRFSTALRSEIRGVQRSAMNQTFLASGMRHPRFVETLHALHPAAASRVAAVARPLVWPGTPLAAAG